MTKTLALASILLVYGCKGAEAAYLGECIAHEAKEDWESATITCQRAKDHSPSLEERMLAAEKLDAASRKFAAQKAAEAEKAAAVAAEKAQRAEAERIAAGGWKYLPRPTDGPSATVYMTEVMLAYPGEPPLKKQQAQALMDRILRELARGAGVQVGSLMANVGDTAGSINVSNTVHAIVGSSPSDAMRVGVCSEAFLGTALLSVTSQELQAAGLRAILCTSADCSAVFDLRPNRPNGGGVYGGDACLSIAEVARRALAGG